MSLSASPSHFALNTRAVQAALWDNLACYLEFPVSTTHTTIGSIMGMALVIGGGDGVTWWQSRDSFPYVRGFVVIVMAWIISPICAFIAVSIVFLLLRSLVLRSKHSFVLSFWVRRTAHRCID